MSFVTSALYTFDGTGSEIPAFPINASYDEVFLIGAATAIGSYNLIPSGTPSQGNKIVIKYNGALDITSNSVTFSIFGTAITQNILNTVFAAECEYYNSMWNVTIFPNCTNYVINPATNIPANSITTAMLQNGSVTNPILANLSVSTAKLQDRSVTQIKHALVSVGTPELIPLAVDASIIASNAVTTTKINTAAVTNTKLAAGGLSTVKCTNQAGTVVDIAIGAGQVLGNTGSGIQAINNNINLSLQEINTTISPSDWVAIGIAGLQVLPSPPAGFYYRIINAQATMTVSTTPYTGADLYISYFSAARAYGIFGNLLQNAGNRTIEIDRASSSASALTQILGTALILNTAGNTAVGGDGVVDVSIIYLLQAI